MINYLWKENKVILYSEDWDIIKKLVKITDFKEREKIITQKYKELFPKE